MTSSGEESFRAKVRAILGERLPLASPGGLDLRPGGRFRIALSAALPQLSIEQAEDLSFHLADWWDDGAFLVALGIAPERFTEEEIEDGVMAFLVHAPNHIAAAAKLGGFPIADIFGIGALDTALEGRDHAD